MRSALPRAEEAEEAEEALSFRFLSPWPPSAAWWDCGVGGWTGNSSGREEEEEEEQGKNKRRGKVRK